MSDKEEKPVKEFYKGKEVIDVQPKEETVAEVEDAELTQENVSPEEPKKMPHMFFTVSVVGQGGRPTHLIVRAESALQALTSTQEIKKAPVMGVHITEYQEYFDAIGYNQEDTESAIIT